MKKEENLLLSSLEDEGRVLKSVRPHCMVKNARFNAGFG